MKDSKNIFLDTLKSKKNIPEEKTENENIFTRSIRGAPEPPESNIKSILRSLYQPVGGIAKAATWPLDLIKLASQGASKEVLMDLMENDPNIKKDIAEITREKGFKYFPTQDLAEELVEKYSGTPLQAKTPFQRKLRLGGEAFAFRPGSMINRLLAGVAAPITSATLQALKVPEEYANMIALGGTTIAPEPKFSPKTKPSGLTERRFEKITKPTFVSSERKEKIAESIEKDFKNLSENILGKNKTYSELKENPSLKEDVINMFEKVENLASNLKENISPIEMQKAFKNRIKNRVKKGYLESEFEEEFEKRASDLNDKFIISRPEEKGNIIVDKFGRETAHEITPPQAVEQFRKNNQSLSELFEPGKSGAANRAKKEVLLEHNRAIADIIKEKYPDSEFSKVFEESNKYWSDIMAIEDIQDFNTAIFEGKINYRNASKFFTDKGLRKSLEKIVGKEGLKNYEILVKDLLSTEKPMGLLRKAESLGFKDLAMLGGEYFISPKLPLAHGISKIGKRALQTLLDKPQLSITWESGIKNLKKGRFAAAEKDFLKLDKEVKSQKD